MFVVDTNVLVYAADVDSPFYHPCRELLDKWQRQASAWYVSWGIVYEFLRVATHPRVLRRPFSAAEAWSFVESLLASPGLGVLVATERHAAVVTEVLTELPHVAGNLMHDLQTAALMREHGIKQIYTRDTDFHRFPFVDPIDPIS